jgi:uncharacterized protein (DUF488 family)
LFTFGYRGLRGAADLRHLLEGTEVDTVVDVRLSPRSDNRAFSLRTRATVEAAGVAYIHLPDLGNLAYKTAGIRIRDLEAIETVLTMLRAGRTMALMCACREPGGCHRQTLAEEATRREPGLRVAHLRAAALGRPLRP